MTQPIPASIRFWRQVDKRGPDECWLWKGFIMWRGYGQFGNKPGRPVRAHRFAYEDAHGPIPEGLFVLHSCDVKACVNPAHLRVGTHQENMDDAVARRRMPRGAASAARAKLTEHDVIAIRERWATGTVSQTELAREYNITASNVSNMVRGLTWKWIGGCSDELI